MTKLWAQCAHSPDVAPVPAAKVRGRPATGPRCTTCRTVLRYCETCALWMTANTFRMNSKHAAGMCLTTSWTRDSLGIFRGSGVCDAVLVLAMTRLSCTSLSTLVSSSKSKEAAIGHSRDTLRVQASEGASGVPAITVSLASPLDAHELHVCADFHNSSSGTRGFPSRIRTRFGAGLRIRAVVLDFMWCPAGWVASRYYGLNGGLLLNLLTMALEGAVMPGATSHLFVSSGLDDLLGTMYMDKATMMSLSRVFSLDFSSTLPSYLDNGLSGGCTKSHIQMFGKDYDSNVGQLGTRACTGYLQFASCFLTSAGAPSHHSFVPKGVAPVPGSHTIYMGLTVRPYGDPNDGT